MYPLALFLSSSLLLFLPHSFPVPSSLWLRLGSGERSRLSQRATFRAFQFQIVAFGEASGTDDSDDILLLIDPHKWTILYLCIKIFTVAELAAIKV